MTAASAAPSNQGSVSILSRQPVLTGIVVGVISLVPHLFLPANASLSYAAVLMGFIAGVYFGFAVMRGSQLQLWVETAVAGGFLLASLAGLLWWPLALPLAYLGHGLWDFLHHNRERLSLVSIPSWYPPWCAIIDVILGAGLIVIWRAHGIL